MSLHFCETDKQEKLLYARLYSGGQIFSQRGAWEERNRSGDSCSTSVCCDIEGYKKRVDVAILSFHWLHPNIPQRQYLHFIGLKIT